VILQIAGGATIVVATSLLGWHFGGLGAKRARDLLEFKKSLIMLKSQIDYTIYTLPQAFLHISERVVPPFDIFYTKISQELEDSRGDISTIWGQAVSRLRFSYLHKNDMDNIALLGTSLGLADVDVQINSIDMVITTIDDTLTKLGVQNAKDAKMYRGLGVVAGLLITIVLL